METKQYANLVLQTCILSILITAPIGEFLILQLGRLSLSKTHVIGDATAAPSLPMEQKDFNTLSVETLQQHSYTKVDELT